MKLKILVCCHKRDVMANIDPYMPIHVGKGLHPDVSLGITEDNIGYNISSKNNNYCELTGLYWAWKNLKDCDIIGLCHYRRYFDFHNQSNKFTSYIIYRSEQFPQLNLSVPDRIIEKVSNKSVIIAKRTIYPYNLFCDYCVQHNSEDLRTLESVIVEFGDKKYIEAFRHVMYKRNYLNHYNMFLMRFDMFSQYCEWLFKVLETVEKRTDITSYNFVQGRIYGYMAERLFNIWLFANNIDSIEKPVLKIDDTTPLPSTRQIINGYISSIAYRITNWINNIFIK